MTRPARKRRPIVRSGLPPQFVWYLLVGTVSFLAIFAISTALQNAGLFIEAALVGVGLLAAGQDDTGRSAPSRHD